MKMKKQNAYLSLSGFMQLTFLTSMGEALNEYLKPERDDGLILVATAIAGVSLLAVVILYFRVFSRLKRIKK